jgi:hypothetical protein
MRVVAELVHAFGAAEMVVDTLVGNCFLRIVRDFHAAYRVGEGLIHAGSPAAVVAMAFMSGMAVMSFMTGWRMRRGWFVHGHIGQPVKTKTNSPGQKCRPYIGAYCAGRIAASRDSCCAAVASSFGFKALLSFTNFGYQTDTAGARPWWSIGMYAQRGPVSVATYYEFSRPFRLTQIKIFKTVKMNALPSLFLTNRNKLEEPRDRWLVAVHTRGESAHHQGESDGTHVYE